MSQVSYGTITIIDTTDLTTYIRYAKKSPLTEVADFQETPTTDTHFIAVLSIPSSDTIPAWNSADWKWSEFIGTDGLSVKSTRILYYLKTNSTNVPQVDKNTSIVSTDTQNAWTSKNPTYVANGTYWTCLEVTLSDDTTKSWSAPTEDLGLTQAAKDAQGAMGQATAAQQLVTQIDTLLGGHFLWHGAALSSLTKAGARVVEQVKNGTTDVSNTPSQWHHNVNIGADGIQLRYNEAIMAQLAANLSGNTALKFYKPPTVSGDTTTQGALAMELNSDSLNFYGSSTSTPDVTLSSTGLNLTKGSITLGNYFSVNNTGVLTAKSGTIGGWSFTDAALYYSNATPGYSTTNLVVSKNSAVNTNAIAGSETNKHWFLAAGRKFGVDTEGNLYANNAHLSSATVEGAITATQLTISSGGTTYSGVSAINASGYSIEIINDVSAAYPGATMGDNNTYLYPILYLNGIKVTTGIIYTNFIWYLDGATTGGTQGHSSNGGVVAEYGHTYRVTYSVDDTAVGEVQPSTYINVDPSKYITRIADNGITVHPETMAANSNYIHIDGNSLMVKRQVGTTAAVSTDTILASFGTTAQIGQNGSSRFLMNSDSLQAYNSSGTKYFEVTENGLSWGSNTAATTTQVNTAAQIASNYITDLTDGGIRIHPVNNENNSIVINSDGMEVFKGGSTSEYSMAFYGETARVGNTEDNHIIMSSADGIVLKQQSQTLASFNSDEIIIGNPQVWSDNYMVISNESIEMRYNLAYDEYSYVALKRSSGKIEEDIRDQSVTETWSKTLIYNPLQTTQIVFVINRGTAGYYECLFTAGTAKTDENYNISYDGNRTFTYTYTSSGEGVDPQYSFYSIEYQTIPLSDEGGYIQVGDRGLGSFNLSNTATFGKELITDSANQVATGRFNLVRNSNGDSLNYAFMIGNGSSGINRSNALTVDWSGNVDIASGAEYRINGKSITSQPIKVVQYGWVASSASSERTRVIQGANPANSSNSSDEPSSSEYTFVAWILFASNGWVGAIYPASPTSRTTDVWTATVKAATTGVSIYGTALYVRNDLL